MTGRLAQAHPVDDGGVVEFVGDDRVLGSEQRLEKPAVGVETRRVQDGVESLRPWPQEPCQFGLEIQVLGLGAADEPHRGHAETPTLKSVLGGRDQLG